jgi:adenylate cyclase
MARLTHAAGGYRDHRMAEKSSGDAKKTDDAGRRAKLTAVLKKLDGNAKLLTGARLLRELLPGDSQFGDPLSTAGKDGANVAGKRLAELTAKRPGVLREAGLSTLQVWQAMAEAQGRGRSDKELTIVFTDLVEFSDWALGAGDEAAVELLRDVGRATEPPVSEHGGEVVKRLGDGMMAVFEEPQAALDAMLEAREQLEQVAADGYEPKLRVGIHVGKPRKLGGDYLGVDVNIAARVAQEANGEEMLVSDRALEKLDTDKLDVKKKRRFSVKGVPKDMTAHAISPKA